MLFGNQTAGFMVCCGKLAIESNNVSNFYPNIDTLLDYVDGIDMNTLENMNSLHRASRERCDGL